MKACTRCGETKPRSEFSRYKRSKDGLQFWCKACNRSYRIANREKKHAYRKASRERIREYNRAYYAAHREEKSRYNREYGEVHQIEKHEYQAEYRATRPEVWRTNCAKRRALKRNAIVGDVAAIAAVYDLAVNGGHIRCYLCGRWTKKGERHVDHIIPLAKGGKHAASNLAIACAACNLSKYDKMPEEVGVLI